MRLAATALALLVSAPLAASERSLFMGFTPFFYDVTAEAQADTYARLAQHSEPTRLLLFVVDTRREQDHAS